MRWRDLSSSEIRRRLVQRGVDRYTVDALVAERERPQAAAIIDHHLRR